MSNNGHDSKMTQLQELTIPTKRTHEIIKHLVQGKTHDEIAKEMNLSRSTVERELRECRDNGELQTWAVEEFLKIHGELRVEDKKECYRALSQLIRRSENVTLEHNYTEIRLTWINPNKDKAVVVDSDSDVSYSGHVQE